MPEYQMPGKFEMSKSDLSDFTQGYIEAAFFTEEERLCEESEGLRNMPEVAVNLDTMKSYFIGGNSFGFNDLAPEALSKIIADCAAFENENAELLDQCGDSTQNGHDFWLTRNGHGAGFWDRGYNKDIAEKISAKARAFGEISLYLGDNGKVYVS